MSLLFYLCFYTRFLFCLGMRARSGQKVPGSKYSNKSAVELYLFGSCRGLIKRTDTEGTDNTL